MTDGSSLRNLATQGSVSLFGKLFGRVLGFGFLVFITRLVSDESFGMYSLGLSLVIVLSTIGAAGFDRSVDYFVPEFLDAGEYDAAGDVVRKVFLLGAVSSGIVTLAYVLSIPLLTDLFGRDSLYLVLVTFTVLIPVRAFYLVLLRVFAAAKEIKYQVYVQNIGFPISRLTLTTALLVAGTGAVGLAAGHLAGMFLALLVGAWYAHRRYRWFTVVASDHLSVTRLLSYAVPLSFVAVLYATVNNVDYLMIGYFATAGDLGSYRVTFTFAANLLVFMSSLRPIFKPMIAERRDSPESLRALYKLATRWALLLTLPPAITILAAPTGYTSVLFTEEFATSRALVTVLVCGFLINALLGPEGAMLEGLGHSRLMLWNSSLLLGINVGLNLLLIPTYGILGAAIATACGYLGASGGGLAELFAFHRIQPFTRKTAKTLASGILSLAVCVGIAEVAGTGYGVLVGLPFVSTATFLIALVAFGSFSQDDLDVARRFDERTGLGLAEPVVRYGQD